uniref:UPAR/Ly6 domain-containing protein n=1 Tax=Poecilia mexicana TaxID=48701 RepID=A0A3B3WIP0_9TELE
VKWIGACEAGDKEKVETSGLRCYTCVTSDPSACTNIETCPDGFDRCASVKIPGLITKSCMPSAGCISPIKCCDKDLCNGAVPTGPVTKGCKISELPCNGLTTCCEGNLCNGAVPTGPGVFLLLMSSALIMLFI